jgi:hypothetical protein
MGKRNANYLKRGVSLWKKSILFAAFKRMFRVGVSARKEGCALIYGAKCTSWARFMGRFGWRQNSKLAPRESFTSRSEIAAKLLGSKKLDAAPAAGASSFSTVDRKSTPYKRNAKLANLQGRFPKVLTRIAPAADRKLARAANSHYLTMAN